MALAEEHVGEVEFVELAEKILAALGKDHGKSRVYEDELLLIQTNHNGLALEIERKEQPEASESHLRTNNPVTMVYTNGEIIRHHGEHAYLTPHMRAIIAKL